VRSGEVTKHDYGTAANVQVWVLQQLQSMVLHPPPVGFMERCSHKRVRNQGRVSGLYDALEFGAIDWLWFVELHRPDLIAVDRPAFR